MPPRGRKGTKVRRGRGGNSVSSKAPLPVFNPGECLDMLNENGEVVGQASVFVNPDGKRPTVLHCHSVSDLQKHAKPGEHYVVIQVNQIFPSHKTMKYPYHMKGADVPQTLEHMHNLSVYIWDSYLLRRRSEVQHVRGNDIEAGKNSSLSKPPQGKKTKLNTSVIQTSNALDGLRSVGATHHQVGKQAPSSARTSTLPPKRRALQAKFPQSQPNAALNTQFEIACAPLSPGMKLPTNLQASRGATRAPPDLVALQPTQTPEGLSPPPDTSNPAITKSPPRQQHLSAPPHPETAVTKISSTTDPAVGKRPPAPPTKPSADPKPSPIPPSPESPQQPSTTSQPAEKAAKFPRSTKQSPSRTLPQPDMTTDVTDIEGQRKEVKERTKPGYEDAANLKERAEDSGLASTAIATPLPQLSSRPRTEDDEERSKGYESLLRPHIEGTTLTEETTPYIRADLENGEFTDEEQDRLPSMVEDEALIVEEDEEDQDDEGDEIKVPDTNERGTYNKTRIRVRIDQLVYPPNLTRDLDMSHVGKLKTSLRKGIEYSLGHITVCHKPSTKAFTPVKYDERKFENVDVDEQPAIRNINGQQQMSLRAYFVANGMHRSTATDRIFREVKDLQDRQEFGVIYVILYSRTDGKELSFYELLALGGAANDIGTISKPPTFADQIYLCVSCLKEILELNPDINITPTGLGKKFREHSIIRASANGTHTKYARVTLTFVRRPNVYKRFLQYWKSGNAGEKFRVSHFQTKAFHTLFTEVEQLLILDALYEFLRHTSNSYFTSPAATRFFIECSQLFNVIRYCSERKRIPMEKMLEETVAVTKQQSVAVSRYFIRTISCFIPIERPANMAKKSAARVTKFKNVLMDTFFPKTEEQKRAEEAEEKQRKELQEKKPATVRSVLSRAAKTNAINATNRLAGVLKSTSPRKVTGKRKRQETMQRPTKVSKTAVGPLLRFDDSVPGRYPTKYTSRPPKWIGVKDWVCLLNIPPHRIWSKEMCVLYTEPWLHGMGVPRKHRSHLFLSAKDLERNHHAVYYHAAFQAALQPGIVKNKLYDCPRNRTEDARTKALRIAREYPDLSEGYLASCREQIMNKGYCVVDGIFDDTCLPPGPVRTVYDEKPASNVVEYYLNQFPTNEEIRNNTVQNKFWEPTFNALENVHDSGQGRFVTRKDGLYAGTEMIKATVEIARYRSALEIRALQLCVAMNLEETGKGMLSIPCTGCRIFTSTVNSERQIAHTDFDSNAGSRDAFSPGDTVDYSVMWTADDAFPIVLWEYSHVLQAGTLAASRKIAQTAQARRILIPPFSCIIIRGDMVYAAPGWKDQTLVEKEAMKHTLPARFHMYICRWGLEKVGRDQRVTDAPVVSDTVCIIDKFQPKVQSNASWLAKAS